LFDLQVARRENKNNLLFYDLFGLFFLALERAKEDSEGLSKKKNAINIKDVEGLCVVAKMEEVENGSLMGTNLSDVEVSLTRWVSNGEIAVRMRI
jgi:hypothetical protein